MKKISVYILTMILLICSAFLLISCGNSETDNNPDKDHGSDSSVCTHEFEVTKEVEATCSNPGYNELTCKLCGEKKTEITTSKLGHTGDWIMIEEPTCYKDGKEERTCSRCGEKQTRLVNSLSHNYVEDKSLYVAPTCTENGKRVYKCTNMGCNDCYETAVMATGHLPVDNGITVKATCTEKGYTRYKCSVCGKDYIDDVINPLGHNMVVDSVIEQSCENGKCTKYKCSHEGCEVEKFVYEGQRSAHEFVDGKCKHCHKSADKAFPFMTASPDNDVFVNCKDNHYMVGAKSLVLEQYPYRSELYHSIIIGRDVIEELAKGGYTTAVINLTHPGDKYMQFWYMIPGTTEWRAFNSWGAVPISIKFADDNGNIDENVVNENGAELKVYYFNYGVDPQIEPTWDDITTEYILKLDYKKTRFIAGDKTTWIKTEVGYKLDSQNEYYLFDGGIENSYADEITIRPEAVKKLKDEGNKFIEVLFKPKEGQSTIFAITGDGIADKHEQNSFEGTPIKIEITEEYLKNGITFSIFYSQWGDGTQEKTSGYRMRFKGL